MKIVNLGDRQGNVKQKLVGFSFKFLFLGPIYLFAKAHIISGLLLIILYYYLLPIPGIEYINSFICYFFPQQYHDIITRFVVFFRSEYSKFVGIGLVIAIQFIISIFIEGLLLRKALKTKKLLPVTEEDARILISIHACNTKVELASSRIQNEKLENNYLFKNRDKEFPYIIGEVDNSKISTFKRATERRKIDELNEIYSLGQITREEYEVRRALIKKEYK